MSALFGPIRQLGYVVEDIETAIRHWTETMRIGPFYCVSRILTLTNLQIPETVAVPANMALTYSGNMQIALIQPIDDSGLMFGEVPPPGQSGLHHFGFFSNNIHRDLQRAAEADFRISQSVLMGQDEGTLFILDQDGYPGPKPALIDLNAANLDLFGMVRKESLRWDGSGPIRRVGD